MSAEPHDEHASHEEHDDDELDSDEPRTPGWLTLLGCALFLLAGIFAIAADDGPGNLVKPELSPATTPDTAATEAAAVAQPAPPTPGNVDPQQARAAAQKLIDQLKLRGAGAGRPGGGRGDGSGRGQGRGQGLGQGQGMGHGAGDGHGH
ncbi:MAG: hypothetical protein KC766_29785 [Myxococcales bacterium]|nr:hypothetical protein [Myxococcales bacterium]